MYLSHFVCVLFLFCMCMSILRQGEDTTGGKDMMISAASSKEIQGHIVGKSPIKREKGFGGKQVSKVVVKRVNVPVQERPTPLSPFFLPQPRERCVCV